MLIHIAWWIWALAAAGLVARSIARRVAFSRALAQALTRSNSTAPTLHDLRILVNRGDWRDPIERHHDCLAEGMRTFCLAFVAALLWWLQATL